MAGASTNALAKHAESQGYRSTITYPQALIFGAVLGFAIYCGIAAGPNASATSAVPNGVGAALAIALAMCALVAYRNGQPPRRK